MSLKNNKQYDSQWAAKPYAGQTYAQAGCAPTSASDIKGNLPTDMGAWLTAHGYASNGYGTYWEGIPAVLQAYGIGSTQLNYTSLYGNTTSTVFDKFRQSVQGGYCGILLMGKSMWTTGGHFIAIVGYDSSNGKYKVYDPASANRDGWHPWSDFSGCIKVCYTTTEKWTSVTPTYPQYAFTPIKCQKGTVAVSVTLFERILQARGIYTSTIDTTYGDGCVKACKKQQAIRGLTQDGICGSDTWHSMIGCASKGMTFYADTVMYGSNNASVRLLQELLRSYGYYPTTYAIDGDFALGTKNSLLAFQRAKKLSADGVAGQATWKALIGF